MTSENFPNSTSASITSGDMRPGTTISTTESHRPEPDVYITVIHWIPIVVPLCALAIALGAYFIVWGVRVWIP